MKICDFRIINDIKLKGNLLACRSLSSWHASTPEATNKNTMLRRKKTMSIIFNHLYIRSNGLCDLKTLYYQTRQTSKRVAV